MRLSSNWAYRHGSLKCGPKRLRHLFARRFVGPLRRGVGRVAFALPAVAASESGDDGATLQTEPTGNAAAGLCSGAVRRSPFELWLSPKGRDHSRQGAVPACIPIVRSNRDSGGQQCAEVGIAHASGCGSMLRRMTQLLQAVNRYSHEAPAYVATPPPRSHATHQRGPSSPRDAPSPSVRRPARLCGIRRNLFGLPCYGQIRLGNESPMFSQSVTPLRPDPIACQLNEP